MATVKNVERHIFRVEGFEIRFLHEDGTDVRGDKTGLPSYPYSRAASDDMTVEAWKRVRFRQEYPGYGIEVFRRNNQTARGNTKLSTVRTSYYE